MRGVQATNRDQILPAQPEQTSLVESEGLDAVIDALKDLIKVSDKANRRVAMRIDQAQGNGRGRKRSRASAAS